MLFIIGLETLSREIRSKCSEELLYDDDFALETLEGLKGRLEVWKGELKSEGLRVNVKKTEIISSENVGKRLQ